VFSKDTQTAYDELLDSVYGTSIQRNTYLINRYREIYGLPFFSKDYEADPAFFAHATRSVNFVLVALFNREKKFLIVYSSTILSANKPVGWRLLGGPIYDDRESIEESVNRIVRKETGLEVAELQPVAALENRFHCSGTTIIHRGLAFLVKPIGDFVSLDTRYNSDNSPDDDLKYLSNLLVARRHKFVSEAEVEDEMAFLNKQALLTAINVLKHKFFEAPMGEVEAAKRNPATKAFHRLVFKPITRKSSRTLRNGIISHVPEVKSILDVSAGDDELILDLASKYAPQVCVANDISWRQMTEIRAKAKAKGLSILFTNHNLTDLPFDYVFDVVLFKNTLHHLHNKEELRAILRTLKRLSRRLLIVDIENPKKGTWSARLLNQYYERFYGDADEHEHHFFTMDKFKTLIGFAFDDVNESEKQIQFHSIETFKGKYMIAVIDVI
jgi:ubiquinone/menaquinone biosynthesis C-methylase UbiE/ADP-ribose pyrophosphatase YjhB (NUDIX family)